MVHHVNCKIYLHYEHEILQFLYLHDVKTGSDELESGMITNFYITKSSV